MSSPVPGRENSWENRKALSCRNMKITPNTDPGTKPILTRKTQPRRDHGKELSATQQSVRRLSARCVSLKIPAQTSRVNSGFVLVDTMHLLRVGVPAPEVH